MLSNSSRKFFLHNTDRTRVEPKKTATFFCLLFIPTFIMAEKKLSIRELRAIKKDANQKNLKKEKRAKANYFDSSVGKKNPQANQKNIHFVNFQISIHFQGTIVYHCVYRNSAQVHHVYIIFLYINCISFIKISFFSWFLFNFSKKKEKELFSRRLL